jgi:membrane-associated phospholipid phosphatase
MQLFKKTFPSWVLLTTLTFFVSHTAVASAGNIPANSFAGPASGTPYRGLDIFAERILESPSAAAAPDQSGSSERQVPSPGTYGKAVVPDFIEGSKKIFSRDNLAVALAGAGLTALAFTVDSEIQDSVRNRPPATGIWKYGDSAGKYYYHLGAGAAIFGAGMLADNRRLADTGVVVMESIVFNGIATAGLKYATRRTRPDGSDRLSFPSAHASSTAAFAASISEMYDWDLKVSVPLYATALFVGASRVRDNKHYLSDVIAGLTLGTVVGTSFARHHKEKNAGIRLNRNISFSPIFEKDVKGGVFTMKW